MQRVRFFTQHSGWSIGCATMLLLVFLFLPLLFITGVVSVERVRAISGFKVTGEKDGQAAGQKEASGEDLKKKSGDAKGTGNATAHSQRAKSRRGRHADPHERVNGGRKSADPNIAAKREGRSKKFEPWSRYEIAEEKELRGRIVAGRKYGLSFDVLVLPLQGGLPSKEQLADISHRLRSDLHQKTLVYFYLPGMDRNKSAWATAHHWGDRFEVRLKGEPMAGLETL